MKKALKHCYKQTRYLALRLLPVIFFLGLNNQLHAQTDSTEKTVTEEPELISPSLELITIQKSDNSIELRAVMKAKVDRKSIKLPLLKLSFIEVADTTEKTLGFVITDANGKAVFNCKPGSLSIGKDGTMHLKVVFAGNKAMDPADAEMIIKPASLTMAAVIEDSVKKVTCKLSGVNNGISTPVANTVIGLYVKRSFFPLKIGEATTDDSGEATIVVPEKLPGDEKGNLVLLAKVDENEEFGNLETVSNQLWGVKVSDSVFTTQRTLWSSHPPLWMLITFFVLMTVVWGHYLVIVIQLYRLRKEEPHSQELNKFIS